MALIEHQRVGIFILEGAVQSFGFIKNKDKPYIYKMVSGSITTFLELYMVNILLIGNDVSMLSLVKTWLFSTFSTKDLGEVTYTLDIRIYRDRAKKL